MRQCAKAVIFLVSAGLFSACATTTLQTVTRAPDFQAARIRKVLVVSLTSTPGARDLLENEFVRQWKERGVVAEASSHVLPIEIPLDKAGLAAYAKTNGFDSVLVSRLLKREKIEPAIVETKSERRQDTQENSTLTQDVQAIVASPEYPIDYEVAIVSVNLYDMATEKRMWSCRTQTVVTAGVPKVIRPFIKVILKSLYQRAP